MDHERLDDFVFPEKGLDLSCPLDQQPPGTTPLGQNVRLYEMLTQRARGGSRSGLSQYTPQIAPAAIQNLNTVVWQQPEATGAANYQSGDPAWTQLGHPGTYILATSTATMWSMSIPIAVDPVGNVSTGVAQGTPQGPDVAQLASPVSLPAGMQVLAYWQPGAFPLDQGGNFQQADLFPGFGFMQNLFPGGSQGPTFGFPVANTLAFTVPSTVGVPRDRFWNWQSGYNDIQIEIVYARAFAMMITFLLEDAYPVLSFGPPPSPTLSYQLTLNGNQVLNGVLTSGQTTGGAFQNDPFHLQTWLNFLVIDDRRPQQSNTTDWLPTFATGPSNLAPLVRLNVRPTDFSRNGRNNAVLAVTLKDERSFLPPVGPQETAYSLSLTPLQGLRFLTPWRFRNATSGALDGGVEVPTPVFNVGNFLAPAGIPNKIQETHTFAWTW